MSGLKQRFAEKVLNYVGSFRDEVLYDEETFTTAAFLSVALGAAVGGVGIGAVMDNMDAIDATPQIGQEVSIQQHTEALATLQAQRDVLSDHEGYIPPAVSSLENLIEVPQVTQDTRDDYEVQQDKYKGLMDDFMTSVHLDTRLNEADVMELVETFEDTHGAVEFVTSFDDGVDYADIMESRARTSAQEFDSELEKAQFVNEAASGFSKNNFNFYGALGFSVLPWLLFFAGAAAERPLGRWKRGETKRSGYKH